MLFKVLQKLDYITLDSFPIIVYEVKIKTIGPKTLYTATSTYYFFYFSLIYVVD